MAHRKQRNIVLYSIAGIIVIAVAVSVFLLPRWLEDDLAGYFKGVRKVQLTSMDVDGRWLPGGKVSELDSIILRNQDGHIVDLVNDKHDFKLIAVTSLSSKCKGVVESMNMIKKALAKYVSIEAFAVFGDSITNPAELMAYRANNNFDVQCIYAHSFDEVSRLSKYQLSLVIDREEINGVQDVISDLHIVLVHASKACYFDGRSVTAQEATYAILSKFYRELRKVADEGEKGLPNKNSFKEIAANTTRMEYARQYDYDCGEKKVPKIACR